MICALFYSSKYKFMNNIPTIHTYTLNGIGMSNRLQIILHVTKESWFWVFVSSTCGYWDITKYSSTLLDRISHEFKSLLTQKFAGRAALWLCIECELQTKIVVLLLYSTIALTLFNFGNFTHVFDLTKKYLGNSLTSIIQIQSKELWGHFFVFYAFLLLQKITTTTGKPKMEKVRKELVKL